MLRTSLLTLAAAAAAATAMALPAGTALAASAAPAASHRSCTWSTSYKTNNGPPGSGTVTVNSVSPLKCEYYRMTIQSTAVPSVRYHSGWLGSAGKSYVDTCQLSTDCSTLNFAWEDRETAAQHSAGSTSWQCRGLFPVGQWVTCSND